MASILNIGGKWRAQVRRKGYTAQTQTFSTKKLAQVWAAKIEAGLESKRAARREGTALDAPLAEIFNRAKQDRNAGKSKINVLEHLNKGLGHISIDKLTAQDVIAYIESRGYGPTTAQHELAVLGPVLKIAKLAWNYDVPQVIEHARMALKLAGKISKSTERERRPTVDELQRLGEWFDAHTSLPMKDLMWFAVHTAMRASEITSLRWSDYNRKDKTIVLRSSKNMKGRGRAVPLLDAAMEIIERQPRSCEAENSDLIFPYNHRTFSSLFPRACQLMEHRIKDLRWHDLRHEGTSRLFEMGYQIHEVAMFTGHKDWRTLSRYTHLKAKNLRRPVHADVLISEGTCESVRPFSVPVPMSTPVAATLH